MRVPHSGGFVVQHPTKWCAAGTMLPTIDECTNAKTVLDPGADAVKDDNYKDAPKGCSRHKGTWYFNTHAEGTLDGSSEPICRTATGISMEWCARSAHTMTMCIACAMWVYPHCMSLFLYNECCLMSPHHSGHCGAIYNKQKQKRCGSTPVSIRNCFSCV